MCSTADKSALIASAILIARRIAKARARPPIQPDDLFSAGNEAVLEVVKAWTGKGNFEAFAKTVLERRIIDEHRRLRGRGIKYERVGMELVDSELHRRESNRTSPPEKKSPRKPTKMQEQVWRMIYYGLTVEQMAGVLGHESVTGVQKRINALRRNLNVPKASLSELAELYTERKKMLWERGHQRLTPIRRKVWHAITQGHSYTVIAKNFKTTKNNVARVAWHIRRTVGVKTNAQLITYWEKLVA